MFRFSSWPLATTESASIQRELVGAMKVQTNNPTPLKKLPLKSPENSPEPSPTPKDSFVSSHLRNSAIITGCGFVPVVGAATNLMSAWATAWDDGDRNRSSMRPAIGLVGAAANVAGTFVGSVGLLTGSATAKIVGLSLLGASGAAAGAMVALTPNR